MVPLVSPSKAAAAAGLPARYAYWSGHSGRRYLFTRTEAGALCDFEEGVAIAVAGERIVWAGAIEAMPHGPAVFQYDASLHVHLLAATAEERRSIVGDLRPAEPCLRLAA